MSLDFSASAILQRMRDGLKNPVNKMEGGFCMDNLQAVSEEMARMDAMEVQPIPDKVLLDTAEGEFLDRRAQDFNEIRNPATASVGSLCFTGEPGAVIPIGTEVLYGTLVFETTSAGRITAEGICDVGGKCQMVGPSGNVESGSITVLRTAIDGIKSVTNPAPFSGGAAAESDDSFRSRILEKIRRPITSGNRNHYIYWAKQVSGVGAAKCLGAEVCGAGKVKVILLSDHYAAPDKVILDKVAAHIEDERTVGADVTVVAATPKPVGVAVSVKVASGYNIVDIRQNVQAAIQEYIDRVNREDFNTAPVLHDEERKSSISYYRIGDLIFGVEGVADIVSYTLNGEIESLTSSYEEFFMLQEVDISGDQ
jgi:uncharacterized phage protein gp47/JayE